MTASCVSWLHPSNTPDHPSLKACRQETLQKVINMVTHSWMNDHAVGQMHGHLARCNFIQSPAQDGTGALDSSTRISLLEGTQGVIQLIHG